MYGRVGGWVGNGSAAATLEYGDPRQVGGRLQHVAVPVYCLLPGSRCPIV